MIVFCYIAYNHGILLCVCNLLIRLRGQTLWSSRNNLEKKLLKNAYYYFNKK